MYEYVEAFDMSKEELLDLLSEHSEERRSCAHVMIGLLGGE